MLRVFWKYCELVRDSIFIFLFLFSESILKFCQSVTMFELCVVKQISYKLVARDDVAINDFLKVFEVFFSRNLEFGSNSCTWGLVMLNNVYMDNVVVIELPRQSDVVRPSRRWSENELSNLQIVEHLDGSG